MKRFTLLALNPKVPFMFLQPLAIFFSLSLSILLVVGFPHFYPPPHSPYPPLPLPPPPPLPPPHHDHFPAGIPVMISFLDALAGYLLSL